MLYFDTNRTQIRNTFLIHRFHLFTFFPVHDSLLFIHMFVYLSFAVTSISLQFNENK